MSSMSSSLRDTIVLIRVLSSVPARWAEEHSQHLQMVSCGHGAQISSCYMCSCICFARSTSSNFRVWSALCHTLANQNTIREDGCCRTHPCLQKAQQFNSWHHCPHTITETPKGDYKYPLQDWRLHPWRPNILLLCPKTELTYLHLSANVVGDQSSLLYNTHIHTQ